MRKLSEFERLVLINQHYILYNQKMIMEEIGISEKFCSSYYMQNTNDDNHLKGADSLFYGAYNLDSEFGGISELCEISENIVKEVEEHVRFHQQFKHMIKDLDIPEKEQEKLIQDMNFDGYDDHCESEHKTVLNIMIRNKSEGEFDLLDRNVKCVGKRAENYTRLVKAIKIFEGSKQSWTKQNVEKILNAKHSETNLKEYEREVHGTISK